MATFKSPTDKKQYHEAVMADNILQTLQQLVQDVIAPDVRELKVRVAANHEVVTNKMDLQFQALMSAISESKAQNELASSKVIAALSERVAVLESELRRAS